MKKISMLGASIMLGLGVFADVADPQVGNVQATQDRGRIVTITYDLDEDAIVTLDVLTNGVSIGGVNVHHVTGDCNKLVPAGSRTICWDAYASWPDHRFREPFVSFKVTAWAIDTPPDYLVVDLSAPVGSERYYQSEDFLPGGLLGNPAYRTSMLVMRRIHAKGFPWQMGSIREPHRNDAADEREKAHLVTLDRDYYIGVFEVTRAQWAAVMGAESDQSAFKYHPMRPVNNVTYDTLRTMGASDNDYPNAPAEGSFLHALSAKTGISFDLPGEAQWEYAARAGSGEGFWGTGVVIASDASQWSAEADAIGRYQRNGGYIGGDRDNQGTDPDPIHQEVGPSNATAVVGSYLPNGWGLYDTMGNVQEVCLDWSNADITGLDGAVSVDAATYKVARGGSFASFACYSRPACRNGSFYPPRAEPETGVRLMTYGAK